METQYTYECGFNAGYILAKFKKSLLTKLTNSINKTSEYLIGLSDGKREYELEQSKDRLDELQALRDLGDRDIER